MVPVWAPCRIGMGWSLFGRQLKVYECMSVWVARTTCVIILQFTTRFSVTRSKKPKSKTLLHFVFN